MIYLTFDLPEGKLIVRNIRESDLEDIANLSMKVFGPGMSLKLKHFQSHLKIFPEGQICAIFDGKIVGNASSLIVNMDDYGLEHHYEQICDDGYIRNHNPKGDSLYGIEVGVDPDYRGLKIGNALYKGREEICKKLNLKNIYIGGRMPNYHKYADQYSPEEYVKKAIKGEVYDPIVGFQSRQNFKYVGIMPNYLSSDPESLKYAALLKWTNKNYEIEKSTSKEKHFK